MEQLLSFHIFSTLVFKVQSNEAFMFSFMRLPWTQTHVRWCDVEGLEGTIYSVATTTLPTHSLQQQKELEGAFAVFSLVAFGGLSRHKLTISSWCLN